MFDYRKIHYITEDGLEISYDDFKQDLTDQLGEYIEDILDNFDPEELDEKEIFLYLFMGKYMFDVLLDKDVVDKFWEELTE